MRHPIAFALAISTLSLTSGCAAFARRAVAFAAKPDSVDQVEALVTTAAGLLDRAIGHADEGGMKVILPHEPDIERDVAAELREVKEHLDTVPVPRKK